MSPLRLPAVVHNDLHMGKQTEDLYLEALRLLNLTDLAEATGRGYRTLMAYRMGERRITEAAAKELVKYLRDQSEKFSVAADALAAALEEEVTDE